MTKTQKAKSRKQKAKSKKQKAKAKSKKHRGAAGAVGKLDSTEAARDHLRKFPGWGALARNPPNLRLFQLEI